MPVLTLQHASGLPFTVTTRSTDGSVSFFVSIYRKQTLCSILTYTYTILFQCITAPSHYPY